MCSVIGYFPNKVEQLDNEEFLRRKHAFFALMEEGGIRGLHAFGIAQPSLQIRKSQVLSDVTGAFDPEYPAIAHCRYSTSGDAGVYANNQPVLFDNHALVFNGVIHMGTREEFSHEYGVECESENDGEVFLRLVYEKKWHAGPLIETHKTWSFAGLWMDDYTREDAPIYAGRNGSRPLWACLDYLGARWYASTKDIFVRAGFPADQLVLVESNHARQVWPR